MENKNEVDIKELERQRNILDKQITEYYDKKYGSTIINISKYVGKCYRKEISDSPGRIYYYKILSELASTINAMTCLVITPFSSIDFSNVNDFYASRYCKTLDYIDELPFEFSEITEYDITTAEEITEKEFKSQVMAAAANLVELSRKDYSAKALGVLDED